MSVRIFERESEVDQIVKKARKLIEFATDEFNYLKKSDISQGLFGEPKKKITQRRLMELAKEYKWGLLNAVEEIVGITYETYLKLHKNFSTRLYAKRDFSKDLASFLELLMKIQDNFTEYVGKDPIYEELERLWRGGFKNLGLKNLGDIAEELSQYNIYILKTEVSGLSGAATRNFILINSLETKERQIWSVFHELLHIIKKDYGLRTVRSPEEKEHDLEVARFFFEGTAPDVDEPLTYEEMKEIYKSLRRYLPVSEWALVKWYKDRGMVIEETLPRLQRRKKKTKTRKQMQLSLRFPIAYWEVVNASVDEDEIFCTLFGMSYYEIVADIPDPGRLRDYVKENYCYT